MKALLARRHGPPESLVLEEIAPLQPGPGQVVVAVHASAVNFPDTLIIAGTYQFQPALPFSPGGEVAGTVLALGAGVAGWTVGERVIAACGWGGHAEEVLTTPDKLVRLPAGVDLQQAAALVMTYGTTQHALQDRAALQPGETLLVLGAAGGTGIAATELGKRMGARVLAAASSAEKLALCRAHGADATLDYVREDLHARLHALTGGRGVDVVYDPVGGPFTEPALRSMAWRGRYLVVGFAAGEIARPPLDLALRRGCTIVGVFYGGFARAEPAGYAASLRQLVGWLADGQIRPAITARLPLERGAEALRRVADRRATGKIVLTTARGRGER